MRRTITNNRTGKPVRFCYLAAEARRDVWKYACAALPPHLASRNALRSDGVFLRRLNTDDFAMRNRKTSCTAVRGQGARRLLCRTKNRKTQGLPCVFCFSCARIPFAVWKYGGRKSTHICPKIRRFGYRVRLRAFPSGGRGTALAVDEVFTCKDENITL